MHVYQDNDGTICISDKKLSSGRLRHLGEAKTYTEFAEIFKHDEKFLNNYAGEIFKALGGKEE